MVFTKLQSVPFLSSAVCDQWKQRKHQEKVTHIEDKTKFLASSQTTTRSPITVKGKNFDGCLEFFHAVLSNSSLLHHGQPKFMIHRMVTPRCCVQGFESAGFMLECNCFVLKGTNACVYLVDICYKNEVTIMTE